MANKVLHKISYEKLDEIFNFVRHSIYQLKELNLRNEDIKILMPSWFKFVMEHSYTRYTYYRTAEQQLIEAKFFDIEVLPHFKNEIVVYCKEFYLNKELDQPKIFIIEN